MFGLSKNRFIDIKKATVFVFSYFIAYPKRYLLWNVVCLVYEARNLIT